MGELRRKMNKCYWDGMAKIYEDEIFSVLHSDRQGLIKKRLRALGSRRSTVADIGCGIGHFLPVLSKRFGRVYANDISDELISQAKERHGRLLNVTYLHGDIRSSFRRLPKVDCVVSVNSLISSSVGVRHRMLQTMAKILKPGGHLILVVPSLESSLFVDVRFAQWKWHDGMAPARAVTSVYPLDAHADHLVRQGIFRIDGVATKHFLEEELTLLLAEVGLDALECVKIEYEWNTEFEKPPHWMKAPFPWDWLVVAQRKGTFVRNKSALKK